jgi:hypothetical protein
MNAAPRLKKLLAEIIAGLIPIKMVRNRWRGILRMALFVRSD